MKNENGKTLDGGKTDRSKEISSYMVQDRPNTMASRNLSLQLHSLERQSQRAVERKYCDSNTVQERRGGPEQTRFPDSGSLANECSYRKATAYTLNLPVTNETNAAGLWIY